MVKQLMNVRGNLSQEIVIKEDVLWQDGRWQGARQCVSPNCCERPDKTPIDLIVLHNISLPPFEYGSGAIEKLFTNQIDVTEHPFFTQLRDLRVSSHFLISRQGEIIQFVSCDKMAYHAGISSFAGREKCNAFSIGIELEGSNEQPFTDKQYTALRALTREIMRVYPHITKKRIVGHCDVSPGRKIDPGQYFDWQRYLQNI